MPHPKPAKPKKPRRAAQTLKNLVGPQVARLRYQAGLSQSEFAAKCQRMGWDISRGIVAGIEGQVRCVTDFEFVQLSRALNVRLDALLPELHK